MQCIVFAEQHIRTLILFSVLDAQREDPLIILIQGENRIIACRPIVANVEIDRDVRTHPQHRRREILRLCIAKWEPTAKKSAVYLSRNAAKIDPV